MMLAFILEGLGTTELLVILVVALILFGPRKLPHLSRSLGKSLGDFKRASEDFKRTWEKEVAIEEREKEARIEHAMLPEDNSILGSTVERSKAIRAASVAATDVYNEGEVLNTNATADSSTQQPETVQGQSETVATTPAAAGAVEANTSAPTAKRDWL